MKPEQIIYKEIYDLLKRIGKQKVTQREVYKQLSFYRIDKKLGAKILKQMTNKGLIEMIPNAKYISIKNGGMQGNL
jgi:Mn-dependent DtxR family transcriptional regulator